MKASEHFDLPVAAGVEDYDEDDLMGANGDGLWYASFITPEQAQIAAKCINHADALADALEDLMEWHVKYVQVLHHQTFDRAHKALEAYRGAK